MINRWWPGWTPFTWLAPALVGGRLNPAADRRFNYARADRDYESAFREAGVGAIGDDPEGVARRIAASTVREPLLAALADWSACATLESRRAWVLEVARRVDPEPWRNRARDPVVWADRTALATTARTAPLSAQPVPFLVALGERLWDLGGDGTDFLARVHQAHPDDFWAALTLARALQEGADRKAAAAAYRRALELRGDSAAVYNNLGNMSTSMGRLDEAADYFRKSLEIDPNFAPAHNNLGLALKGQGKWSEADQQFRDAIRFGPELAPPHDNLGEIRAHDGWAGRGDRRVPAARYGSTPSSAGPSTCSASRWPPGAGWTKQKTAISGLSATTP